VTDIDMEVVSRLFEHYRQYDRAVAALGTAMFVTVSPNQVKANPALDAVLKLDTAILRLENELGKTPMARARLGIAVGEAVMTAAELNRIAKESDARDDDEDTKLLEEFQPD
jgi:P27 family predicted phage terminase small subunit